MNPEVIDKIEEALRPLAEAAGEGAEYAWEVLIRQMMLSGAVRVMIGLLLLIPVIILGKVAAVGYSKFRETTSVIEKEDHFYSIAFTSFIGSLVLIFSIGAVLSGVMRLLNPGYYALEHLSHMVGVN